MKAVWSFWSKPYHTSRRSVWLSETHHLLAWVLSLETARQHFAETALVTDRLGAHLLIDELGLKFDQVSTDLDALEHHDPLWWALGKLYTYRAQTQPFVHLDSDVFLWKPLPQRLTSAPLCAQNPEYFAVGASYYQPAMVEATIHCVNGWLPEVWRWQRSIGILQTAVCCGIFGGHAIDFIHDYADLAIQLVEHPTNQLAWSLLSPSTERNILVEQYLLGCWIEFHRSLSSSRYKAIDIEYLFSSLDTAFTPEQAERAGYTHLIANAKRNSTIGHHLEKRVKQDYSNYFNRAVNLSKTIRDCL